MSKKLALVLVTAAAACGAALAAYAHKRETDELFSARGFLHGGSKFMNLHLEASIDVGTTTREKKAPSKGQPDLIWVVRRIWDRGYITRGGFVHFTTLADMMQQNGLDVDWSQVRSALEMVHCPIESDLVYEMDLARMFESMDNAQEQDDGDVDHDERARRLLGLPEEDDMIDINDPSQDSEESDARS